MAARWVVLFPGAAVASIIVAVEGGFRRWAGRQEALSWRIMEPDAYSG
jgi:hypothetical protein